MKIYEIYFSPTGGTKKVADILTGALQGDVVQVDLTDYRTEFQNIALTPDDVAIAAVPSFGGRAPATAMEHFSKIKGNGARAVLVCAYGNRAYEDTLVELQDTADAAGFRPIAAVAAISEHSIVREVAQGRPNGQDEVQLVEFAKKIQIVFSEKDAAEPELPGNRPYKKMGSMSMVPKPTKACTQCGICAEKCPVQVIDAQKSDKVDEKACISCMRCVSVCPESARKLNGVMLAGVSAMLKKVCAGYKANELLL